MSHKLKTPTPEEWANKTNIIKYGERQAQSCNYLEDIFSEIEDRAKMHKSELSALFGYLIGIHKRQYSDLEQLTNIHAADNRTSFYFDSLYAAFGLSASELPEAIGEGELLTMLSIQAVSYLRGQDRYNILKKYEGADNAAFKAVWARFYGDATSNAQKVFHFIYSHFDKVKAEKRINDVIQAEDVLIHAIWRHKNVKGS